MIPLLFCSYIMYCITGTGESPLDYNYFEKYWHLRGKEIFTLFNTIIYKILNHNKNLTILTTFKIQIQILNTNKIHKISD